ncbi:MAG: hypothetical protein KJS67_04255 [Actinomycetales bacterium]|nr:hypothetical protein [Actinomycetales bacterium]
MKLVRRLAALIALLALALKGALSFLSWAAKQDETESVWADESEEDEMEEAF